MNKITVTVCLGTTCHLMGASHLQALPDDLPEKFRSHVRIEWKRCLDLCKNGEHGKAPFVIIDGKVIEEASVSKIIECIERKLDATDVI